MKNSQFEISSSGQAGLVSIDYYFRKPGDDYAVWIGYKSAGAIMLNSNSPLRTMSEDYFSDCPTLVEKIKNKELKFNDTKVIMDYYNTKCE